MNNRKKYDDGFKTSSMCWGNPGVCVEVRRGADISVRDSKSPGAGTLVFTRDEWSAFVAGVKADEFDV